MSKVNGLGTEVFTSGQVARICQVAPRTASKWFDSGHLKGYRIPGSNDRRVLRSELIRFLKENGMPLGELAEPEEPERRKVLLVATEAAFNDRLAAVVGGPGGGIEIGAAASAFEAGLLAANFAPNVVVIDFGLGRSCACEIASRARGDGHLALALIVGLPGEDEADPDGLAQYGFDHVFKRPFDPAAVAAEIQKLVEGAGRGKPVGRS